MVKFRFYLYYLYYVCVSFIIIQTYDSCAIHLNLTLFVFRDTPI